MDQYFHLVLMIVDHYLLGLIYRSTLMDLYTPSDWPNWGVAVRVTSYKKGMLLSNRFTQRYEILEQGWSDGKQEPNSCLH